APLTRAIRTYSATSGAELIPAIAGEFDLKVAVGAWVERDKPGVDPEKQRTARELRAAVELVRGNRNVHSLVVGNEAIFRGELLTDAEREAVPTLPREGKEKIENNAVGELIKLIQSAKRKVEVPVTTGEIYSVWLNHPELVAAVDYIAVHILPYWNHVPDRDAVEQTMRNFETLRQAYPGKRIVIAE